MGETRVTLGTAVSYECTDANGYFFNGQVAPLNRTLTLICPLADGLIVSPDPWPLCVEGTVCIACMLFYLLLINFNLECNFSGGLRYSFSGIGWQSTNLDDRGSNHLWQFNNVRTYVRQSSD